MNLLRLGVHDAAPWSHAPEVVLMMLCVDTEKQ